MAIITKIYPNGEASLYFERWRPVRELSPPPEPPPARQRDYIDLAHEVGLDVALSSRGIIGGASCPIGLVTAPISPKKPKTVGKSRGLTRLGARTLRQGAYYLEEKFGKDQITFLTATVPAVSDEELDYIWENWAAIVKRFMQRIKYRLEKCGIAPDVIHVTEIQPKRAQDSGQEVPHLHVVFQGKLRRKSWAILPKMIEKWWKSALKLPFKTQRTYSSSCQLARVKSSVSRYLSKYIAKKRSKTGESTSSPISKRRSLGSWWGVTSFIKRWISLNTKVRSGSLAEMLWSSHEEENREVWEYQGTIESAWDGGVVVFCRFGRLTPGTKKLIV